MQLRVTAIGILLATLLSGGAARAAVGAPAVVGAPQPMIQRDAASGYLAYTAPVTPLIVVRGFAAPPTPYLAGHRGVDVQTERGDVVRAASDGVVSFAGSVADRGVVVIRHADGIRTEYEPVAPAVATGDAVKRGSVIGRVRGRHGDCPADRCLHWGARRGDAYFDPLRLLRPLGPVRLLPWPRD